MLDENMEKELFKTNQKIVFLDGWEQPLFLAKMVFGEK